jgi:hypothetical protein
MNDLHHCNKMTDLLSGAADGTLTGWQLWFTNFHVKYCPGCAAALDGLKVLCVRLSNLGAAPSTDKAMELPGTRWSKIESAWEAIETQVNKSG